MEAIRAIESFKIRHQVYCEELQFEPKNNLKLEKDEFDAYSMFCLLQHKYSEQYVGTVRIITPQNRLQKLPIEKYCSNFIYNDEIHPNQFRRNEICEISRLALIKEFRRCNIEDFLSSDLKAKILNNTNGSLPTNFSFAAIGLYMAAAYLVLKADIKHAFVMMEPKLARALNLQGLNFKRIGDVIDYHGRRAPYYLGVDCFLSNLPPMLKIILAELDYNLPCENVNHVFSI